MDDPLPPRLAHPSGRDRLEHEVGTLPIPTTGHDFQGATRYEIVLTVTDSTGLSGSTSVTIFPDKVNLTFNTVPSGLTVEIDGISRQTPFVLDDLNGFQHTIDGPEPVERRDCVHLRVVVGRRCPEPRHRDSDHRPELRRDLPGRRSRPGARRGVLVQ